MEEEGNGLVEVDNASNTTTVGSTPGSLQDQRRILQDYENMLRPIRMTLERLLSDVDPVDLDLDELKEYKDLVGSIKQKAVLSYNILFHNEKEEALRTGNDSRWQALQDLMRRVSSLNGKLTSIKIAQSWVGDVDSQLEMLVLRMAASPGMDFGKGITGLLHASEKLAAVIRKSTIPIDHPIRKVAKDMSSRIIDLQATEKMDDVVGREEKFSPGKPSFLNAYRMDRISLPKFDGSLEHWAHFWSQFQESVHDNSGLTKIQKLSYLRQSMTNQQVKNLLLTPTSGPEVYDKLIAML